MKLRKILAICLPVLVLAIASLRGCGSGDSVFSSAAQFEFVVFGDTRGDLESLELVDKDHFPNLVSAIDSVERSPDFILFTGDAGFLGTQLEWDQWMNIVAPLLNAGIPLYPTLGNHEVILNLANGNAIDAFKSRFENPQNGPPGYEGLTFSFDHEGVHVVCLTTNAEFEGRVDDTQIDWLASDLAGTQNNLSVLFFHEPAYPTGAHIGSSLDRDPAQRDKLWEVIDKAKVDLVFNGHEHNYSRWTIDNRLNSRWQNKVVQVVAGGGGAPLYEKILVEGPEVFAAAFQYVVVEVREGRMDVIAVDEGGQEIDRFSVP